MKCHRVKGVLIPGCWNRVIHGDDADCHCNIQSAVEDREIELSLRIEKLEKRIKLVENKLKQLTNTYKQ